MKTAGATAQPAERCPATCPTNPWDLMISHIYMYLSSARYLEANHTQVVLWASQLPVLGFSIGPYGFFLHPQATTGS
jgi:hypothetical protein